MYDLSGSGKAQHLRFSVRVLFSLSHTFRQRPHMCATQRNTHVVIITNTVIVNDQRYQCVLHGERTLFEKKTSFAVRFL